MALPGTIGGAVFSIDADYTPLISGLAQAERLAVESVKRTRAVLRDASGRFVSGAAFGGAASNYQIARGSPPSFGGSAQAVRLHGEALSALKYNLSAATGALHLFGGTEAFVAIEMARVSLHTLKAASAFGSLGAALTAVGGVLRAHPIFTIGAAIAAAGYATYRWLDSSNKKLIEATEKHTAYANAINAATDATHKLNAEQALLAGKITKIEYEKILNPQTNLTEADATNIAKRAVEAQEKKAARILFEAQSRQLDDVRGIPRSLSSYYSEYKHTLGEMDARKASANAIRIQDETRDKQLQDRLKGGSISAREAGAFRFAPGSQQFLIGEQKAIPLLTQIERHLHNISQKVVTTTGLHVGLAA